MIISVMRQVNSQTAVEAASKSQNTLLALADGLGANGGPPMTSAATAGMLSNAMRRRDSLKVDALPLRPPMATGSVQPLEPGSQVSEDTRRAVNVPRGFRPPPLPPAPKRKHPLQQPETGETEKHPDPGTWKMVHRTLLAANNTDQLTRDLLGLRFRRHRSHTNGRDLTGSSKMANHCMRLGDLRAQLLDTICNSSQGGTAPSPTHRIKNR